jgi:hypothetical protein
MVTNTKQRKLQKSLKLTFWANFMVEPKGREQA